MTWSELKREIPELAALTPEAVLKHPAWRLSAEWLDESAVIRPAEVIPAEGVWFSAVAGEAEFVLGVSASTAFPEFSELLQVRNEVPSAVLQAVVEKEAGTLLQILGKALGREVVLKDLAKRPEHAFDFVVTVEEQEIAAFSLAPYEVVMERLGDVSRLDRSHSSLAELKLVCEPVFAEFDLRDEELCGLEPGDRILLPELDRGKVPEYRLVSDGAKSNRCRVTGRPEAVSLAVFTENPCVEAFRMGMGEEAVELFLYVGDRKIASGHLMKDEDVTYFSLETVC